MREITGRPDCLIASTSPDSSVPAKARSLIVITAAESSGLSGRIAIGRFFATGLFELSNVLRITCGGRHRSLHPYPVRGAAADRCSHCQAAGSAFQMSTAQRQMPSGSRRQTVTVRPVAVLGSPSAPFQVTALWPNMYARFPSGEKRTSVEAHVIRNPGIRRLALTYSRRAAFPTTAGRPGGSTTASSVQ